MTSNNHSTFENDNDQQNISAGHGEDAKSSEASNVVNETTSDESSQVDDKEKLSIEEIIALEISRNRSALRRTATRRGKKGSPVVPRRNIQHKGTPVLEKPSGPTEAQVNQLVQMGFSILFVIIAAVFTWYVLLPEVETSPATPYQATKKDDNVDMYRKMFGLSTSSSDTDADANKKDVFEKSMTLGQEEEDLFEQNKVLSGATEEELSESENETSSNDLIAIPSPAEFEDMDDSQKRAFVQRVLRQMETQVQEIEERTQAKYSSNHPQPVGSQKANSTVDTIHAGFDSWADHGKGDYEDLLRILNKKHQDDGVIQKSKPLHKDERNKPTTSKSNKQAAVNDSVLLITVEGEVKKVSSDSIKKKSEEAEKQLVEAIAHEMKMVKMNAPDEVTQIPEKYAKNIEGLLTTHVVGEGETLSSLSRLYYRHIKYASYIYAFNREKIEHKDVLPLGVELDIPKIKGVKVVDVKTRNK